MYGPVEVASSQIERCNSFSASSYFCARVYASADLFALPSVLDETSNATLEALSSGLPVVETGSYYVKAFRALGALPQRLAPLGRGDVVRLCFKPTAV